MKKKTYTQVYRELTDHFGVFWQHVDKNSRKLVKKYRDGEISFEVLTLHFKRKVLV